MNENKLAKGQNVLVLRFSPNIRKDIIEQHKDIISLLGFCWYGKLGRVTNESTIYAITQTLNPMIMLYCKDMVFLCDFVEMTTEKPKSGYPEYYDTELLCPSCYFKLTSIESVDMNILSHFFVRSSKRKLSDVFSGRCMSSSLLVAYEEIIDLPKYVKKTKAHNIKSLGKEECVYKRNGVCTLTSNINYTYECERPSYCKKQKR